MKYLFNFILLKGIFFPSIYQKLFNVEDFLHALTIAYYTLVFIGNIKKERIFVIHYETHTMFANYISMNNTLYICIDQPPLESHLLFN